MAYSRRLHHRPIEPSWLELSTLEEEDSPRKSQALIARERLWATVLGAVAGGIGGAAMLLTAQQILRSEHSSLDAMTLLGAKVGGVVPAAAPEVLGIVVAVALGAVLGSLSGRLTWRVSRIPPRILFFAILAPVAWIFAHAFIIHRGSAAALPFAPFAIGALLYGLCLAVIPALRRVQFEEILPKK